MSSFTRPSLPALPPNQTSLLTSTPLPVPSFPNPNTMSFTILSRLSISAPPSRVVAAILDVRHWHEWNTFVPSAEVHSPSVATPLPAGLAGTDTKDWLRLGDKMTMRVNMDGKPLPVDALRTTPEVVTVVEPLEGGRGWRVCWRYGDAKEWLLRAERVQEVVETEEGCEYVTWESFGGWMAGVVRLAVGGKLKERFADWGRDLKGFCERERERGEETQGE